MLRLGICLAVSGLLSLPLHAIAESSSEIAGLTAREARLIARAEAKAAKKPGKNKDKGKGDKNAQGLKKVCKSVSNLGGLLLKTTAGGHIGRNDPRYPGFSIICAGNCVPFPAKVYHCDGSQAFSMGYYGRWSGNGKSRGYCGHAAPMCHTSSVRSRNSQIRCAGAAYLSTGGGRCMRFNVNSDRNGGV